MHIVFIFKIKYFNTTKTVFLWVKSKIGHREMDQHGVVAI